MWHTCTTCHKTYTLKCNLRRHINSAHIQSITLLLLTHMLFALNVFFVPKGPRQAKNI